MARLAAKRTFMALQKMTIFTLGPLHRSFYLNWITMLRRRHAIHQIFKGGPRFNLSDFHQCVPIFFPCGRIAGWI